MRRPVSWGAFTRLLSSVLFLTLLAASRVVPATAQRRQLQEATKGDDSQCLKGFITPAARKKNSTVATWNTTVLDAPCNYSTGTLKGVTCNNSRVVSIVLRSANLTGTIPSSISSCYFLQTLDLSSNFLSGPLPSWVGYLLYLSVLSLSNNHLSGPIPDEVGTLGSLTYLDLSRNQLSGSIPPQFGLLDFLQYFNVSNNNLSGLIPSSFTPRFTASSFFNNPHLFGYPLSPSPPFLFYTTPPSPDKKKFPTIFVVWVGLVSGLGWLAITSCTAWLWIKWRHRHDDYNDEDAHCFHHNTQYMGWMAKVWHMFTR